MSMYYSLNKSTADYINLCLFQSLDLTYIVKHLIENSAKVKLFIYLTIMFYMIY